MARQFARSLIDLPLTWQTVAITLVISGVLWVVLDRAQTSALEQATYEQAESALNDQAEADRLAFTSFISLYRLAAEIFASHENFVTYVERLSSAPFDSSAADRVIVHNSPPAWYPSRSISRKFGYLSFALLLDADGGVREVYAMGADDIPLQLLRQEAHLQELSHNLSYITAVDGEPYLITSDSPRHPDQAPATLMLATHLSTDFLIGSQGLGNKTHLTALVSDDHDYVYASTHPQIIPSGDTYADFSEYLIAGASFFEYGASDLPIKLITLRPIAELRDVASMAILRDRQQRALLAVTLSTALIIVILWVTQRINGLTSWMLAYSKERLGFELPGTSRGNEISVLADRFHALVMAVLEADSSLKTSEERYRKLTESASDAIVVVDADDFSIVDANQATSAILGESGAELLGRSLTDFLGTADTDVFRELARRVENGEPSGAVELAMARKDGESIPVELTCSVLSLGSRVLVQGIVRDISERKRTEHEKHVLEQQLRQSQKLEAVGTLAGGVAHDFNNILTPIVGYAAMLADEFPEGSPMKTQIDEIMVAGDRAKELVRQILTFSRNTSEELRPVTLRDEIETAMKLMRSSLPTNIEIRTDCDDQDGRVMANPVQIHQIIVNLCTNAGHAMKERGGELHVRLGRTTDARLLPQTPLVGELRGADYLVLTVRDTGTGMSSEIIANIFDPFFTTKGANEGTGLGLSVIHGIIKQYHGAIEVDSEPGKGSCFTVYLPAITDLGVDIRPNTRTEGIREGRERILLAEDDRQVGDMLCEMLRNLGYDLERKENGLEALEAFQANPGGYDLILTDNSMPKLTGIELVQRVRAAGATTPIIICSGYADLDLEAALRTENYSLIMKPISFSELDRALRKALDYA